MGRGLPSEAIEELGGHHGGAESRWTAAEAAGKEKGLVRQRARKIMVPETATAVARATPWETMSEEEDDMRRARRKGRGRRGVVRDP